MSKAKNILYYGACWPTNIGNAFIDLGSIQTLKIAAPDANIFMASELQIVLFEIKKQKNNALNLAQYIDCDYVAVSGMTCCDEFIKNEGPILRELKKRGVKIIFNGCGQENYTEKETDNFKKFLKEIHPEIFISRDSITYKNLAGTAKNSFDGIDCAFWLPEAYTTPSLLVEDYIVKNFDTKKSPKIETDKKIFNAHHQLIPDIPRYHIKDKENLISDVPYDYLTLYANAEETYSDRVHACIATLIYGKKARLYSPTPRAYLFEKTGVGEIREKLVKLDQNYIEELKSAQIAFLQDVFK